MIYRDGNYLKEYLDYNINYLQNYEITMETIDIQRALKEVIDTAISNVNGTSEENWTLGLVESRIELLQGYWNEFQANHLKLLQKRNLKIDKYRHDNVYGVM